MSAPVGRRPEPASIRGWTTNRRAGYQPSRPAERVQDAAGELERQVAGLGHAPNVVCSREYKRWVLF